MVDFGRLTVYYIPPSPIPHTHGIVGSFQVLGPEQAAGANMHNHSSAFRGGVGEAAGNHSPQPQPHHYHHNSTETPTAVPAVVSGLLAGLLFVLAVPLAVAAGAPSVRWLRLGALVYAVRTPSPCYSITNDGRLFGTCSGLATAPPIEPCTRYVSNSERVGTLTFARFCDGWCGRFGA
jgi:hypothetical protein